MIITDQRMPNLQGTDLLEEVSKRSPSTARRILTAHPGPAVATSGLRLRMECRVSKPWDSGMLRKTIRQLLRNGDLDQAHEEADRNRPDGAVKG